MNETDRPERPRPPRPLVLYDGACPFCRAQAARIQRRDEEGLLECRPMQAEGLAARYPQLLEHEGEQGLRFIDEETGDVAVGADAVYAIARRLPLWRRFAWLYRVPVFHLAFRLAYRLVAHWRGLLGRWTCGSGQCEILDKDRSGKDPS